MQAKRVQSKQLKTANKRSGLSRKILGVKNKKIA